MKTPSMRSTYQVHLLETIKIMRQCYCINEEEEDGLARLIQSADSVDHEMAAQAIRTLKRERDYIDLYNMHMVLKLPVTNDTILTPIKNIMEKDELRKKVKNRTSDYVCVECGQQFLTEKQRANPRICTFHQSTCCLCGEEKGVTNIRHYNYLNAPYAAPETNTPIMDLSRALGIASSTDRDPGDKR